MGYVTRTDCVGGIMRSHTFEECADFVKWSMQQAMLCQLPSVKVG
ncbi:MAG: hypothetical protein ACRC6V_01985 [Bacteroidales bacterium]